MSVSSHDSLPTGNFTSRWPFVSGFRCPFFSFSGTCSSRMDWDIGVVCSRSFSLCRRMSVCLRLLSMTEVIFCSLNDCRLLAKYSERLVNGVGRCELSPTKLRSQKLAISDFTCKELTKHVKIFMGKSIKNGFHIEKW